MSIPKGYKLVPVEPTEEMQIAGGRDQGFCSTCRYDNGGGDPASTYTAMLDSAPAPPQPIFDEASERDRFDAEYEKICCRTGITIREIAWRMWQSRAKAGQAGHE